MSVFSRGGQNFDRLPRGGGAKYEIKQILCVKTQKITAPAPPPKWRPCLQKGAL